MENGPNAANLKHIRENLSRCGLAALTTGLTPIRQDPSPNQGLRSYGSGSGMGCLHRVQAGEHPVSHTRRLLGMPFWPAGTGTATYSPVSARKTLSAQRTLQATLT